jgi:hypothetical protein
VLFDRNDPEHYERIAAIRVKEVAK